MIHESIDQLINFDNINSTKKDVVDIILSTKYRKSSLDKISRKYIEYQISSHIRHRRPIRLMVLMGGFKQARINLAPYPDWAEIFNINFILNVAHEIVAVYPCGVEIVYAGNEFAIPEINNYTEEDIYLYVSKFKAILDSYQKIIDPRITIYYDTHYHFDPIKLLEDAKKRIPQYKLLFEKYDKATQEKLISRAFRNIKWKGKSNLTALTANEKMKYAKEQFILNWSFVDMYLVVTEQIREKYINISFRKGLKHILHYGSCSSSSVQFWAGFGVMKKSGNKIHPWIYSPDQMKHVQNSLKKVGVTSPFFTGLDFSEIWIAK